MKKCKNADKYKAIHPPKCNGGEPCDVCLEKWNSTKGEFKWTESGYLARKAVREVTQSDD